MLAEKISNALGAAMESVLETMFFTMPDRQMDNDETLPADCYRIRMTFSGACEGRFEVQIAKESARAMASSFTGAFDPDELTESSVLEVTAELTNMICGAMLSQWAGDAIFSLSSPAALPAAGEGPDSEPAVRIRRAFEVDGGFLAAQLELNGLRA